MASSTSGRQTVADVAVQQSHLEGRITGLERDMQNMSQAVSALTETVGEGFRDTREIMSNASRRQDERTSELHKRLDQAAEKSADRGRWNPGLIIAAITCAVLIGGIIVAFVQMKTTPMAKDDVETRALLQRHCEQADKLFEVRLSHADQSGYMRARMEALEAANLQQANSDG